MSEFKPLTLSRAYATWVKDENDNCWVAYDTDNNKITQFPEGWDEHDCMAAIRLGRTYELEAFNKGIEFGKEKGANTFAPLLEHAKNQINILEEANLKLSSKLEQLIIDGE